MRVSLRSAARATVLAAGLAGSTFAAASSGPSPAGTLDSCNSAPESPLLHVQIDKPSYRLGETIWFRVHIGPPGGGPGPVSVVLLGPDGAEVERAEFRPGRHALSGSFHLSRALPGGAFLIEARSGSRVAQRVPIEVYDLVLPRLELSLTVLGDGYFPGDTVTASFRALGLDGSPVAGARVEYLATFGALRIRDAAGVTGPDGRALVRFQLPRNGLESGWLAAGVEPAGVAAATARPIRVFSTVRHMDAFPEGGSVVAGHPHRVALLFHDGAGRTTGVEGRLVDLDDGDRTIAAIRAGARGLATAVVPYDPGHRYAVRVDRPRSAEREFPLPEAGRHRFSLAVERAPSGAIHVEVNGAEDTLGEVLDVLLAAGEQVLIKRQVRVGSVSEPHADAGAPSRRRARAGVQLPSPEFRGLAHVIVMQRGRALLKRPVIVPGPPAVEVSLKAQAGAIPLVGQTIDFDIKAVARSSSGETGIRTDLAVSLFQGDPTSLPDLSSRHLVVPHIPREVVLPAGFLNESDAETARRHDAFVLAYGSFAYPPGGIAVDASGLPAPADGRVVPPDRTPAGTRSPAHPSSGAAAGRRGKTAVRSSELERLLARAYFTRSARSLEGTRGYRLAVAGEQLLAQPEARGRTPMLPQDLRIEPSRVDTRGTLFWSARVQTTRGGRATIRVPINEIVSDITWVVEGWWEGVPISARGTIECSPGFAATVETPEHACVGDVFDVMVSLGVSDGRTDPVSLALRAPPCLKPLLRTELEYRPRTDAKLHKFSFEVVAAAEEAELRLVARRGDWIHAIKRPLRTFPREVEVLQSESGTAVGVQSYRARLPADVVPGSVRVEGSVAQGLAGRVSDWIRRLLRRPRGCFEQFTSMNFLNLALTDALLERGQDPELLEQAYVVAREGFDPLIQYRDPATGAFRVFPDRTAELSVHATVIAVRHLALYSKIFYGLGRTELETAISWLEERAQRDELSDLTLLHLTLSLHEIGRTWQGSAAVVSLKPRSLYQKALQACCLASWPATSDRAADPKVVKERSNRLEMLLEELAVEYGSHAFRKDAGEGLLGSRGGPLSLGTLALYALALHARGRTGSVLLELVDELARRVQAYGDTQGTALAVAAYARLGLGGRGGLLSVEFRPGEGLPDAVTALATAMRPFSFEREVSAGPGADLRVEMAILADTPRPYRLGCRYRLRKPRKNPDAAYTLRQRLTPTLATGATDTLRVHIEPAGAPRASQVVARIGLPGGASADACELDQLVRETKLSYWMMDGGFLDLYWNGGIASAVQLAIPIRAVAPGTFAGRPSVVYPYYEAGVEGYAPPLHLKVINTFGNPGTPEELVPGLSPRALTR